MVDDIKLNPVGNTKHKLPRGIHMVRVGEAIVLVRRIAGRFVPIPEDEEKQLAEKFGWIDG